MAKVETNCLGCGGIYMEAEDEPAPVCPSCQDEHSEETADARHYENRNKESGYRDLNPKPISPNDFYANF